MTGKEIELMYSESGRVFIFRCLPDAGHNSDMDFGDFAAHDVIPIEVDRIEAIAMEVGATGRVLFYMNSGKVFAFETAIRGTVGTDAQAVVAVDGVDIAGATAYDRAEMAIEVIYDKLNYAI